MQLWVLLLIRLRDTSSDVTLDAADIVLERPTGMYHRCRLYKVRKPGSEIRDVGLVTTLESQQSNKVAEYEAAWSAGRVNLCDGKGDEILVRWMRNQACRYSVLG